MRHLPTFVAVACLAAAPALAQETVTVETARGATEVPQSPESIAVYDVAAIDTLDALGIAPNGIIDRLMVDYLSQVSESAEVVGTIFEPDFEALNALQPDLVIIGGRTSEQFGPVSRLAPTIDMTIAGDDLVPQALARLEAYGTIFDREAEAEALASQFDAKLDEARAAVAGKGDALIVMTNGPRVSAYGPGSRFGWFHDAVGLEPVIEDVEAATHGEAISFEFISNANPDWLIVIDRAAAIGEEGERASQTLNNELVAKTTAWQKKQVIYLNPADTYIASGGIQSMTNALDTLIEGFDAAGS